MRCPWNGTVPVCIEQALRRCCYPCLVWSLGLWDATSSSLGASQELGPGSGPPGIALVTDRMRWSVGHYGREEREGKEAKGKSLFRPEELRYS